MRRMILLLAAALLLPGVSLGADGDRVANGSGVASDAPAVFILCDSKTVAGNCPEFDIWAALKSWTPDQMEFSVQNDTMCTTPSATISLGHSSGGKVFALPDVLSAAAGESVFTTATTYRFVLVNVASVSTCSPGYTIWATFRKAK